MILRDSKVQPDRISARSIWRNCGRGKVHSKTCRIQQTASAASCIENRVTDCNRRYSQVTRAFQENPDKPESRAGLNSSQWSPSPVSPDTESFAWVAQFLRRRSWLVGSGLLLGLSCGVVANSVLQKKYTAVARVEIVPDQSSQFRVSSTQSMDEESDLSEKLDTEIELLKGRSLALETIRALNLPSNPDFLPLPKGQPWDLSDPAVRDLLVMVFEGDLTITRVGHTSLVQIGVTTTKPQLSGLIANALIDNYISHSFRDNYATTERISRWLNSQLEGLKENLEKSQSKMLGYQQDLGIVGIDGQNSILVANLQEMNKQYADAQVDRVLAEARLKALQSASPDVIDAGAASNPGLQAARQSLTQLQTQYAALSQTYGPAYPATKSIKAQMDQLDQTVKRSEKAQVERAQAEYQAAKNHEDMLRSMLDAQEESAFSKGQKDADYQFARQDYQSNRLLYDGLQERLQEAGIMAGLHSTAVRIVDQADIPPFPSYPRTRVNKAIGMAVGSVIGLLLALLLEVMDTKLKTITDIERSLQLPLLAAIPVVDLEGLQPGNFKEAALTKSADGWSRIAEALRGFRTALLLSSPGAPPRKIMIVSTRPAEGKSSFCALAAITFALNGSRVLLLDADLRRPTLHSRFNVNKNLGLSSVLSGKTPWKEATVPWPDLPGLHILPSGPVPPLPSELLGSRQMEEMLDAILREYDFVFIDTPPMLAVTDASVICRLADAVVLIVRYGTVERHVVQRSIDLLDRAGAHLLGVVVNAVDYRAPEYEEYYGRKYYEYHSERNPD